MKNPPEYMSIFSTYETIIVVILIFIACDLSLKIQKILDYIYYDLSLQESDIILDQKWSDARISGLDLPNPLLPVSTDFNSVYSEL